MIRCKGGFLYTGITLDVERRLAQHKSGKGAKYLRGKAPLELVFQKRLASHSEALKLEIKIKKYSKVDKEKLISLSDLDYPQKAENTLTAMTSDDYH